MTADAPRELSDAEMRRSTLVKPDMIVITLGNYLYWKEVNMLGETRWVRRDAD